MLLLDRTEVQPVSTEEPTRLPPGHVERRQVSNEILAFQLTTLQDSQTSQNALLRDLIKDGFGEVKQTLKEHTEQISEIKIALAQQDARLVEQERFRSEIEGRERETAKQTVLELQSASMGANDARQWRNLAAIAAGAIVLATGILTLLQGG